MFLRDQWDKNMSCGAKIPLIGSEWEKVWRMSLVGLLPEVSLHYSVYWVGA